MGSRVCDGRKTSPGFPASPRSCGPDRQGSTAVPLRTPERGKVGKDAFRGNHPVYLPGEPIIFSAASAVRRIWIRGCQGVQGLPTLSVAPIVTTKPPCRQIDRAICMCACVLIHVYRRTRMDNAALPCNPATRRDFSRGNLNEVNVVQMQLSYQLREQTGGQRRKVDRREEADALSTRIFRHPTRSL